MTYPETKTYGNRLEKISPQKRTDGIKAMSRGFSANVRTCSHISFITTTKIRTFFLIDDL